MADAILEQPVKRKLLLVDDSGLARRSMRSILEASDFEVVEAEDGMIALEKYFVERPISSCSTW